MTGSVALDDGQARAVGDLLPATKRLGLSLGDRACLALALALGWAVYTCDCRWRELRLDTPPLTRVAPVGRFVS